MGVAVVLADDVCHRGFGDVGSIPVESCRYFPRFSDGNRESTRQRWVVCKNLST